MSNNTYLSGAIAQSIGANSIQLHQDWRDHDRHIVSIDFAIDSKLMSESDIRKQVADAISNSELGRELTEKLSKEVERLNKEVESLQRYKTHYDMEVYLRHGPKKPISPSELAESTGYDI